MSSSVHSVGSAYRCLLSGNSVSAVFINGFKNCVEINTEQGHDLVFSSCAATHFMYVIVKWEENLSSSPQSTADSIWSL